MPKNPVTDPITDQEIAFAHLILAGTMTDRKAAKAAGINPDTAAYTKAKPRVRDYMIEHRAAVNEKLVDHEVEGLRQLNLGRDQILARLWELAKLDPEVTRGSMAGQIKALTLIVAIESLIPGHRSSAPATQPTAPPIEPKINVSEWRPQQQPQAPQPEPPAKPASDAPSPNLDPNHSSIANPFIHPEKLNRVPTAMDYTLDTVLHADGALRLPTSPKGPYTRGR